MGLGIFVLFSEAELPAQVLEQGVWALGNIAGLAVGIGGLRECGMRGVCNQCVVVSCALQVFCFSHRLDFRRLRDR